MSLESGKSVLFGFLFILMLATLPSFVNVEAATETVPGAPSLSAGEGTRNAQASLLWNAPTDTGSSPITDYKIEYQLTSANTWSEFTHTPSNATSIIVTGLANDYRYNFRVSAINSVGNGPPSNVISQHAVVYAKEVQEQVIALSALITQLQSTISQLMANMTSVQNNLQSINATILTNHPLPVTPTETTTAPDKPTNLTGEFIGNKNVKLFWTAPANNGGFTITDYKIVYLKVGTDGSWLTASDQVSTNTNATVYIPNFVTGTSYELIVIAINSSGEGAWSDVIAVSNN